MMRWLLFGFVLLLAACGGDRNPLADTEWRLIELDNADAPAKVVGDDATAEFTTATDMTGWTGCNSYEARYSVRGSELRLDDLRWTERGCPSQELFRQEQRMQDSLATVEWFGVSGERLTLHSEGGKELVFERVRHFSYAKLRYRGLAKNTQRLTLLLGLTNLIAEEGYL